jgi:hypothetical protein
MSTPLELTLAMLRADIDDLKERVFELERDRAERAAQKRDPTERSPIQFQDVDWARCLATSQSPTDRPPSWM